MEISRKFRWSCRYARLDALLCSGIHSPLWQVLIPAFRYTFITIDHHMAQIVKDEAHTLDLKAKAPTLLRRGFDLAKLPQGQQSAIQLDLHLLDFLNRMTTFPDDDRL